MTEEELNLTKIANDFRLALESLAPANRPTGWDEFPRGACGDASSLLGAHLANLGIHGFEYICGHRGSHSDGSWRTHAWLHRDGLIVDLTADQFADAPGGVLVVRNSAWHKTFEWAEPSSADFRELDGPGIYELYAVFDAIKDASNR